MASELLQNYKDAFGTLWDGVKRLGKADPKGMSQLLKGGGEIILAGWGAVKERVQKEKDEDYGTIKNIIMTSAMLLAVVISVVAGVAVVAGLSTIAPPLVFASSCAGVVSATVEYFKDSVLFKKLNKELVTESEILEKIARCKGLEVEEKQAIIGGYIQKPRIIYDQLYRLRKEILMDESISTEDKNKALVQITKGIEDFYKGNTKALELNLGGKYKERAKQINENIVICGVAKEQFNKLVSEKKLPRSLFLSVEKFKKTRENIHAQDLPQGTKKQLNDLLDSKNFKKDNIKLVYAQMANQFLNQSAPQQVKVKDQELLVYCRSKRPDLSEEDHKTIEHYLNLPREILDTIDEIKRQLPESVKEDFLKNIENPVKMYTHENIEHINYERVIENLDKYSQYDSKASQKLLRQLLDFRELRGTPAKYGEFEELITRAKPGKINAILPLETDDKNESKTNALLQSALDQYQRQSAVWHNSQKGIVIPSPNIDIREDKDEKGIMSKVSSKIFSAFRHSKDEIAQEAEEGMDAQAFGKAAAKDMKKDLKNDKKGLEEGFDAAYHNGTAVLEKATKRNYLRKSKPRRLLNIAARVGIAIISGISTALLPLAAAPGGIAANVVLGVVSTVLTGGAIANSIDLYRKERKADKKVSDPNKQAQKGVSPDFMDAHKKSFKAQQKRDKKHEKENKSQASLSSGYHTDWQSGQMPAVGKQEEEQPLLERNNKLEGDVSQTNNKLEDGDPSVIPKGKGKSRMR